MLALEQPAEAKIVYTPAHHVIPPNKIYDLDLNHDGIPDFELSNFFTTGSGESAGQLLALKEKANEIWAAPHCSRTNVRACAAPLRKGTRIGPKAGFRPASYEIMAAGDVRGYQTGYWFNVTRHLGLKFVITGQPTSAGHE